MKRIELATTLIAVTLLILIMTVAYYGSVNYPHQEENSMPTATPAPTATSNPFLSIQILSPVPGELYQVAPNAQTTDIPLKFTVNKPVSWIGYFLEPFLPGSQNVTIRGNTTVTGVRPSSIVIWVYANDTQGNMASDYVWFEVGHTPIVTINSPINNTVFATNNISVDVTAYDPSTGVQFVEYRLEGTSFAGVISGVAPGVHKIEGIVTLSELTNGRHTLTAVAHSWLTGAVGSSAVYFTIEAQQSSPT